jgi:hypothetical protein
MTQCVVSCHDLECRTKSGYSRRWRHLCEDCAQAQMAEHRRGSGHTNLELAVVTDIATDTARSRRQANRAYWVAKRLGVING